MREESWLTLKEAVCGPSYFLAQSWSQVGQRGEAGRRGPVEFFSSLGASEAFNFCGKKVHGRRPRAWRKD